MERLNKCLDNLGFTGEIKSNLAHEIAFEIRSGTLKLNNVTGKMNSPDRILSIALKLVREGRWQTPALFSKRHAYE